MDDDPIVVVVERLVCGRNTRLRRAHIAEGPAYVKAHIADDDLGALCIALSENGHDFTVRHEDVEVSILDFCTGVAAKWCPIHGDCTCPSDEEGGPVFHEITGDHVEDDACPLHGAATDHAE